MRILIVGICAALLSLAVPAALWAQTATNGIVRGLVTDPDTAIIPGASVTLTSANGDSISGASGSDGTFRIAAPAGTYTVTVAMPGFATLNNVGVKVVAGQVTVSNAKLIVGEQTEVVTVTSNDATVSVDSDSNASATVIKGADLDALSDDPDELSSELTALAGPSAGPNGGQIYVDGFTGGQLPPKSSIREIRINQNPFSAEYDKLGFGRIEVFTKPGTDKIRGSMSVQGNDNVLNTSNPFLGAANTQPPYHTFFLLGNVTGPLSKIASYSVAGSRRTIQTNVIVDPTGFYSASPTAVTPCDPGTITGCANYGYPVTARAVFQPQLRWDITPRIDLALGSKNVLTARYQYEETSTQNSGSGGNGLPSTFANVTSNENTIQVTDTETFNPKVVTETRFEYQRAVSNSTGISQQAAVTVQGNFISGGASSVRADTVSSHFEVQSYSSVALQKHFIRFGGRLRTTGESSINKPNPNGLFTYNFLLDPCTDPTVSKKPSGCTNITTNVVCDPANATVSSYQCGTPSQFRLTTVKQDTVNTRETDLGLYAEDDWKVRPNFTLSAGVRLETENVVSSHDFAPRISVAYGIRRSNGKAPLTVLRGGFGIFYDRFALADFLNYAQLQPTVQTQETFLNPGAGCTPTPGSGPPSNCGDPGTGRHTVYALAPGLRSSYTMQAAIGLDQQLGKLGTVSINYLPSRGNHQIFTRVAASPTEIDETYESMGVFRENQLFINANVRTKRISAFGYYSMNIANTNAGSSTFNPTSTNPRVDYGRAAFASRQYAVIGASYTAPYKISLSPFMVTHSGNPYNITTGQDNNNDSVFNDRPTFANGVSANCSEASSFGAYAGTDSQIPINYCTGPAAVTFNLRVARSFGFGPKLTTPIAAGGRGGNRGGGGFGGGGRGGGGGGPRVPGGGPGGGPATATGRRFNLTLGAQAQNLFNDVNYAPPTATSALTSTQFGKLTQLSGRPFGTPNAVRVIQLQATLNF